MTISQSRLIRFNIHNSSLVLQVMRTLTSIFILSLLCASYISAQIDLEALARKIHQLGEALYRTMVELPIGQGGKFLENIREFNNLLRNMIDVVHADKNGTKTVLDGLVTAGHPKFLDTPFTDLEKKKLLDRFNWTLDDLDLLYADRITAYTYWTDLLLLKNDNYQYDA